MSISCPVCGGHLAQVPVEVLLDIRLPNQNRFVLQELIRLYPRSVSKDRLLDALYGHVRTPAAEGNGLNVILSRLRKELQPYGWTVSSARDGFGASTGHGLKPVKGRE